MWAVCGATAGGGGVTAFPPPCCSSRLHTSWLLLLSFEEPPPTTTSNTPLKYQHLTKPTHPKSSKKCGPKKVNKGSDRAMTILSLVAYTNHFTLLLSLWENFIVFHPIDQDQMKGFSPLFQHLGTVQVWVTPCTSLTHSRLSNQNTYQCPL